jgi:hypothetical protein
LGDAERFLGLKATFKVPAAGKDLWGLPFDPEAAMVPFGLEVPAMALLAKTLRAMDF